MFGSISFSSILSGYSLHFKSQEYTFDASSEELEDNTDEQECNDKSKTDEEDSEGVILRGRGTAGILITTGVIRRTAIYLVLSLVTHSFDN